MAVAFAGHLLTTRQQCLHIADGNVHIGGILDVLLHHAGDELAALAAEGAEHAVVLRLAEELLDYLACRGCRQTAEIMRGVIVLLAQFRSGVRIVFGGFLRNLVTSPDGEAAGARVEFDSGIFCGMRHFQIGESQRLRQCGIHGLRIYSLFLCECVDSVQIEFQSW